MRGHDGVLMVALGNYYEATRRVALETPALDGDISADVAVIGGGITGVSAALHLAERGFGVALLEAEHIGWGASGRNGGQVLPGFGASESKVKTLVGAERAKKLWDMSVEAVDLLHSQIQRFGIPCDPVIGYLHSAVKPRHVRELRESQEELAALGSPVGRILEGEALRARLASPKYLAALEDSVSGHIHCRLHHAGRHLHHRDRTARGCKRPDSGQRGGGGFEFCFGLFPALRG